MPLKVPNYRAVSEMFRKKAAAEPPALSHDARDRIEWIRKNPLPQPSGPLDMSDQDLYPPPTFAVPTPTQPPPQSFAPQLPKPPMQRSTMPLSAPLSDPRLDHLAGDSVTRRDAISTALGEPRATNFIDKSTAYRQANPKLFEGVYDGGNIDRPMKVIRKGAFYPSHGLYSPVAYVQGTNEIGPGNIKVRGDNPFTTLMHELFHLDTSGSRPQDVEGAFADLRKGNGAEPIEQLLSNRLLPVGSQTGKDAKVITDRSYYPNGGGDRNEMGSQLGALRVHLEQLGIDTSNKEALRKALSTMGDDPRIMHNFEAQRIHRALNDPTLSPEERERGLDALVELMPGIAKSDTTQYPYRKVASDPSSPLRGLTIMSTISALLKGR